MICDPKTTQTQVEGVEIHGQLRMEIEVVTAGGSSSETKANHKNRRSFETPSIFIKHLPSTLMQNADTTEAVYGS
jgi:hypothetical protein